MAGCFGNHPVDRMIENQLFQYLNSNCDEDTICPNCKFESSNPEDFGYDEDRNILICPKCQTEIKL
jgi:hypothetical protein